MPKKLMRVGGKIQATEEKSSDGAYPAEEKTEG
jgi:hypothetical protein